MSHKRRDIDEIKKSVVYLKESYETSYEKLKSKYFEQGASDVCDLGKNVFSILEDIIRVLEDKEKN